MPLDLAKALEGCPARQGLGIYAMQNNDDQFIGSRCS